MITANSHAYRVTVTMDGAESALYAVGATLADAAADAQSAIPPGGVLARIEFIGDVLTSSLNSATRSPVVETPTPAPTMSAVVVPDAPGGRRQRRQAKPRPPATTATRTTSTSTPRGQRLERLRQFLTGHDGTADLDALVVALGTNRANIQNIITASVKAGLIERLPGRSGLVRLLPLR